jgi:hypothetical protein
MSEPVKISLNPGESLLLLRTLMAVRGLPFKDVAKPDIHDCDSLIKVLKAQKGKPLHASVTTGQMNSISRAIQAFLAEYHEADAVHAHVGFWPKDLQDLQCKLAHEVQIAD